MRPWVQGSGYSRWHYFSGGIENYSSLHDEGGNILYGDGHADYRKGKSLRAREFGLTPKEDDQTAATGKLYSEAF